MYMGLLKGNSFYECLVTMFLVSGGVLMFMYWSLLLTQGELVNWINFILFFVFFFGACINFRQNQQLHQSSSH